MGSFYIICIWSWVSQVLAVWGSSLLTGSLLSPVSPLKSLPVSPEGLVSSVQQADYFDIKYVVYRKFPLALHRKIEFPLCYLDQCNPSTFHQNRIIQGIKMNILYRIKMKGDTEIKKMFCFAKFRSWSELHCPSQETLVQRKPFNTTHLFHSSQCMSKPGLNLIWQKETHSEGS